MISWCAVGADANHAAARIRGPQRAVTLGEDAFGPLQIVTDEFDLRWIDNESRPVDLPPWISLRFYAASALAYWPRR